MERNKTAIIIGAGPAGLSAAYNLLKITDDIKPIILEQNDYIGGISKTVCSGNIMTDIGPHRLYTKNTEVFNLWEELLPLQGKPAIDYKILGRKVSLKEGGPDPETEDSVMLKRQRITRILYNKKFFDYPISMKPSTFINMGFCNTFKAGMSYLKSCIHKVPESSLEDFMINRFGKVLYSMFFEKYTQKVWGLHPSKISKEWGEQRIKGLSLIKAVLNAILSPFHLIKNKETSLIDEYYYPKYGCSQLWQRMADEIMKNGGEIHLNCNVESIHKSGDNIEGVCVIENGIRNDYRGDILISSMPIKNLIDNMNDVPNEILNISTNLEYRDYVLASFLCSNINLPNNTKYKTINNLAPDSWIYLHEEGIKAGRIHIMNNFSPYAVKNFEENVIINLEYFCSEKDEFWQMSDDEILDFGFSEFQKLNILQKENILEKICVRVKKAYPAYFGTYKDFDKVKIYLNSIQNLYCIGRNGQHKYNNMDHSVLSGLECARVIKDKLAKDILWDINTEQKYNEVK